MAQAEERMCTQDLFGGAAKMSLPERLVDVADFRQVPNNQEVFADGSTDQSLIVDILEHKADVADRDAARFFFEDLAHVNEATSSKFDDEILHEGDMGGGSFATMASGVQQVSKGRQGLPADNQVQMSARLRPSRVLLIMAFLAAPGIEKVLIAVIRYPEREADVVISLNTPVFISEHSVAAEHAGAGLKNTHLRALPLFKQMLSSFEVVNHGLFGGGGPNAPS